MYFFFFFLYTLGSIIDCWKHLTLVVEVIINSQKHPNVSFSPNLTFYFFYVRGHDTVKPLVSLVSLGLVSAN